MTCILTFLQAGKMAMDRGWAINIGWFLSVIFSPKTSFIFSNQ